MKKKSHNKINYANDIRYSVAPQMKIYDGMGTDYEPYFMFTNRKNYRSDVCNTDINGFRFSSEINNENDIFKINKKSENLFLLGASTAFGVGTTKDKYTLSGLLSNQSINCFNISGRAYSGFQEILSLLLSLNNFKPSKIVILSGINDVFLNLKNKNLNKDAFGSFFFSSNYKSIFNEKKKSLLSFENIKNFIGFRNSNNVNEFNKNYFEENKSEISNVIKRNLEIFGIISKGYNIKITYCLQPFFNWIKKEPSDNEMKIVEYLNTKSPDNNIIYNMISENYEFIKSIYEDSCGKNNIDFLDVNERINQKRPDNINVFVDRVHLSNTGTDMVYNIIKDNIK